MRISTIQAFNSELPELDCPEALSRLSFQSISLDASQQRYVSVAPFNVFNKM